MPLIAAPAIPFVAGALSTVAAGIAGFFTGFSASNKLGTGLAIGGAVVGLFLIFVLAQRFKLLGF